jgi:copper homeostasis protein CutC
VLELRAVQALTPVAEPLAMVIHLAADRAVRLSRQLPGVTEVEQGQVLAGRVQGRKKATGAARRSGRATQRTRATA